MTYDPFSTNPSSFNESSPQATAEDTPEVDTSAHPTATGDAPFQDHRYNSHALDALMRELSGRTYDAAAVDHQLAAEADKRTGDWRAVTQNAAERHAEARKAAASAAWTNLDELALRRCAAWIIQSDAFGRGVTKDEAQALRSYDPALIATTARKIVGRLVDEIPPPDVDGELIAASDFGQLFKAAD